MACRSSMCCCSVQSTTSSKASPSALANVLSNLWSNSRLGKRTCSIVSEKDWLKRRFRRQTSKRFRAGRIMCAHGRPYDALQNRDGFSLDSELLHAVSERKLGRAHSPSGESRERYPSYRDGYHDDGRQVYREGQRGLGKCREADDNWQSSARRNMEHFTGESESHISDERWRRASSRTSDGRVVQDVAEDPKENRAGPRATVQGHGGNQRNGSGQKSMEREPTSNIPISELMKIEELRFCSDLQEGDSGPQVLNLQRALFWLGHLRGLSLTGYFGPETTRALQEFHISHGLPSTGVWGYCSQQVLWKQLHLEPHRTRSVKEIPERSGVERKFPDYVLSDTWLLVKNVSGKVVEDGLHATQALQQWRPSRLREFAASVSALPRPTLAFGRVGILLLSIVVLSSTGMLLHSWFARVHGQPVKRRVMSWRGDVDLRQRAKKGTVSRKYSEGESLLRYFQNRLRPKPTNTQEENVLDRLVLFDGQLLRGDQPKNNVSACLEWGSSTHNGAHSVLHPSIRAKSPPVLSRENLYESGSELGTGKGSHGFDRPEKLEVDPPRKISSRNWSPMQSEIPPRQTGGEQLWSGNDKLHHDVSRPGWATSLSHFLATLFPNKERDPQLPCRTQKTFPRRAVVRSNLYGQKNPSERMVPDSGSPLTPGKLERGIMINDDVQKWQEKDELDLKKQVEELHRTVQSVEQTRGAAMQALAEEKMRNLELEVKYSRQKELAACLEKEVHVLKDAHEALLASLRKKYSSPAAARAAAALLYQNWDPSGTSARSV